jgi:hypothetical protein
LIGIVRDMSGGIEGEQARQDLPAENRSEQGAPDAEGVGNTWLARPEQEQQTWQDRPHAELVAVFRSTIQQEQQALGDLAKYHSPVKIMDAAFRKQVQYLFSNNKEDQQRGGFFAQILHAWQIIAYEHYGKGSVSSGDLDRHHAGLDLCTQYQRGKARNAPHPEIMTLTDPLQVRIIDAAAEAVDIPHPRGQISFEIPQTLWDYEARVQQANEARRRRGR